MSAGMPVRRPRARGPSLRLSLDKETRGTSPYSEYEIYQLKSTQRYIFKEPMEENDKILPKNLPVILSKERTWPTLVPLNNSQAKLHLSSLHVAPVVTEML